MKKTTLKQYAKLIAVKGVNIQKGQEVIINASLENSPPNKETRAKTARIAAITILYVNICFLP
jgi:leucyl aminopeptidase (aminopeptidase T)